MESEWRSASSDVEMVHLRLSLFATLHLLSGAIAQLGERVLCKHEVVGSIPSGSTRRLIGRNERRPTRPESFALPARSSRLAPVERSMRALSVIVKRKHIQSPLKGFRSLKEASDQRGSRLTARLLDMFEANGLSDRSSIRIFRSGLR